MQANRASMVANAALLAVRARPNPEQTPPLALAWEHFVWGHFWKIELCSLGGLHVLRTVMPLPKGLFL